MPVLPLLLNPLSCSIAPQTPALKLHATTSNIANLPLVPPMYVLGLSPLTRVYEHRHGKSRAHAARLFRGASFLGTALSGVDNAVFVPHRFILPLDRP